MKNPCLAGKFITLTFGPLRIVARMAALAVQIVNYRTKRYLERCLATVVPDLERSGLSYEVNLLENCSGESLVDLAAGLERCRAFTAPRNLGFGAGHNVLASKTAAAHLLILNPDVELMTPETAVRLLRTIECRHSVKAVGPKLLSADGRAQPYDHGRLRGLRAEIALRGGHSYWRETDIRQEVAWISGAALLIERGAFTALGGFDEKLFLYKEDEDLCLRLRAAGGEVIYDPAVAMRHQSSVVAKRSEALAPSVDYFAAKHFPNRRTQRMFAAAHQGLAYLRL